MQASSPQIIVEERQGIMAKQRVAWLVPAKSIFNFELDMSAFDGIDVQIDRTPVSSPGEAMEAVKGADVVMAMAGVVDARLIAAMDKAKAICSFGHGFDRIDVEAATKAGIMVTNTAYIGNWEVANHAAAMVLALNRKLAQYDRAMRGGVWDRAAGRPIGPLDGEVAGLVGLAHSSAYSAAKAGVIGLTRTVAVEYGPQNIRVNCICPGFVSTPMLGRVLGDRPESTVFPLAPLRRVGQAEDVARAALYLASDEASYVTGVPFVVDGGYSAG
jgi:NAD(P)-dependent dehydrogenase (short-subunit alcohol dehydrogenase family)